jgi:tetraacyldisaccharide 4'-kinase
VNVLSAMYGTAATWRRRWYAGQASRVKRLARPVISVGNLRVGGSGKTPVVAHLAELLLANGERPSILSRGYKRARQTAGVTVVSDGVMVRADLAHAGDEPLMLARALPRVPVLVGADRYASGLHAERELGVTVHILDDGFQHVRLARDVDLLLVDEDDLRDRVLPAGRLREPLANASAADAALVTADPNRVAAVAAALGIGTAFGVTRRLGGPRFGDRSVGALAPRRPAFAFAGIAKPERFFRDLAAAGWPLTGTLTFDDHYAYSQSDFERLAGLARQGGAEVAVTTEKDAVRLEGLDTGTLPIVVAPLMVSVEPSDRFIEWLMGALRTSNTEPRTSNYAPRTSEPSNLAPRRVSSE